MRQIRRLLGIFVMVAGVIGLALSLTGLIGVWVVRPTLQRTVSDTMSTLSGSLDTSLEVMTLTGQALEATSGSVEALSGMLAATANTVEETQPVITQAEDLMGLTLPDMFDSAVNSLEAASQAATSLESTVRALDTFRAGISANPLLRSFIPADIQPYEPEESLARSLGRLARGLEDMPPLFEDMSSSLNTAGENLGLVRADLETMSTNIEEISSSLSGYLEMIDRSGQQLSQLQSQMAAAEASLPRTLTLVAVVLTLFFAWMLAAQIVILSQGWELYRRATDEQPEPAAPVAPAPAG